MSRKPGEAVRDLASLRHAWRDRQRKIEREREAQARREAEVRQRQQALERERAAFRQLVGPVTPMPPSDRILPPRQRPDPLPRSRQLDDQSVLRESLSDEFDVESLLETDADLAYRRAGIGPDVLAKLRRGHWATHAELDLHGMRRDEARDALGQFFRDAARQGWRCVRIVHGKGLGSPGREPVLKAKVRTWLVQKSEVLAFVQARADEGGAGALIVLLQPN